MQRSDSDSSERIETNSEAERDTESSPGEDEEHEEHEEHVEDEHSIEGEESDNEDPRTPGVPPASKDGSMTMNGDERDASRGDAGTQRAAGRDAGRDGDDADAVQTPGTGQMLCTVCGAEISENAVECPNCGEPYNDAADADANRSGSGSGHSVLAPGVAVVGAFFPLLAGAGQFVNRDFAKGIAITVTQFILLMLIVLTGLRGIFYFAVAAGAVGDAYLNS